MKPWAWGVIDLLAQDPDQQGHPLDLDKYAAAFDNENVKLHRYRGTWANAEPTEGARNFATVDDLIGRAKAKGQRVGLSWSAGCFSPKWPFDKGATRYHAHYNDCDMPLPWDPVFQAQFIAFIKAAGARYEADPTVAYVNIAGWMQHFDAVLGDLTDEAQLDVIAKAATYKDVHEAVQTAGKAFVDAWCQAFPTTSMMFMTDRVFPDDAGLTDYKNVQAYAAAKYKNFGVMPGNGLKAMASPPPPPAPASITNPKIEQFFGAVTGQPCSATYLDPIPSPCPADPKALTQTFAKAAGDGAQAVETYLPDITPSGNQSALAAADALLKANVPPGH